MAEEFRWAAGGGYESYVGRWSRLVAAEFVDWLELAPGSRIIDIGCGTGALTTTLLVHANPSAVVGVDPSPGYVDYVQNTVIDARARFEVADAENLPFDAADFDAAVSGLVLNFVPHPDRGLAQIARVVRDGGCIAAYVWDYAGRMELIRHFWDAAVELDLQAEPLDEGERFPICEPARLAELFSGAGLVDVETRELVVPTVFRDFDDYWRPFLSGEGPAPGYAMALPEERRAELRDRIRARLPIRDDGSIALVARAWAVRGMKKARSAGLLSKENGRRPTLPGGCPPSTIGPGGLNCSVRNGKRCFPAGMTAQVVEGAAQIAHPQNSIAAKRVQNQDLEQLVRVR
jgi:SAM-dependent methyltransferase